MQAEKYTQLLQRYLQNKATAADMVTLKKLTASGQHDETLKENIDLLLKEADSTQDMTSLRAKAILEEILITETTTKPIKVLHFPIWKSAVAAAIALLVITGIWLFLPAVQTQYFAFQQTRQHLDPDNYRDYRDNTLASAMNYTGKQYITLPDGTTVLMNENTELSYKAGFGHETREVILSGEAFFDVAQNPTAPFIIIAGDLKTTVLGTSFNIKAYKNEAIEVTVETGKVKVEANTSTPQHLIPIAIGTSTLQANEQVVYNPETQEITKKEANPRPALAWKKDFLIFNETTMGEVTTIISEKYNVNITFDDPMLKTKIISASFLHNETLEQVLTVITGVLKVEYEMRGDDVMIK